MWTIFNTLQHLATSAVMKAFVLEKQPLTTSTAEVKREGRVRKAVQYPYAVISVIKVSNVLDKVVFGI